VAARYLGEAVERADKAGHAALRADATAALGQWHASCGRFDDARHHLRRALESARTLGDRPRVTRLHAQLATVDLERGDLAGAGRSAGEARTSLRKLEDPSAAAAVAIAELALALARGEPVEATEALRLAGCSGRVGQIGRALALAGQREAVRGDHGAAAAYFDEARSVLEAAGERVTALRVSLVQAATLRDAGQEYHLPEDQTDWVELVGLPLDAPVRCQLRELRATSARR